MRYRQNFQLIAGTKRQEFLYLAPVTPGTDRPFMKKQLMYYCSPFMVAALLCLIPIVFGLITMAGANGLNLFLIFVPTLLLLLGVDYLIKSLTKGNVNYIWIIEAILITLTVICIVFLYGY
jgi:hypothetical protein